VGGYLINPKSETRLAGAADRKIETGKREQKHFPVFNFHVLSVFTQKRRQAGRTS
jgi:hypothetical protein